MDLWRPAMAKFQIGTPPLYHRYSDRFSTTPSFHSTTQRARYKERGPAHQLAFSMAWPASDLPGDVTGTFGMASSASVRMRQEGRAHARAQPMSTEVVAGR